MLLRPSQNHFLPRDAADGCVQAAAGVHCGDFLERCAGAGGTMAECEPSTMHGERKPVRELVTKVE